MNYIRRTISAHLACPQKSLIGKFVMRKMAKRNDYLERCAVECACLSPTDTVLEIGFGHGLGLKYAAQKVKEGRVYGIDISELALYDAEELLHEEIAANKVTLYHTPVNNIPLNSESISMAFSCNSFYFWPSIPTACAEIHRVLKPGGQLLTVQNIDNILARKKRGGFERANVDFVAYMKTLEEVGFEDVKIEYLNDQLTSKPYQCIRAIASS
ncbi:uncharacterized methyltransferase YdaC-like [Watersipora subatra]|uniref:uncharacterized methyltransferase YdaC-like n=1 Tax=Watersipora subatra TaxID=2589382 RepID=UPI00355C4E07